MPLRCLRLRASCLAVSAVSASRPVLPGRALKKDRPLLESVFCRVAQPFLAVLSFPVRRRDHHYCLTRAGAHSHDKIGCRCCTYVLDPMFVIGMRESGRPWSKLMTLSIDREFHGSFPNQPHFGMHVMVWRMWRAPGRQRRFVHLQGFAGGELAFQDVTKLGPVRRSNRQLFEGIHCRSRRFFLRFRSCESVGLRREKSLFSFP